LMVVTDLGDHIPLGSIVDRPPTDLNRPRKLVHHRCPPTCSERVPTPTYEPPLAWTLASPASAEFQQSSGLSRLVGKKPESDGVGIPTLRQMMQAVVSGRTCRRHSGSGRCC